MVCIFDTVFLDLTAGITDPSEGRGAYWRFYGRKTRLVDLGEEYTYHCQGTFMYSNA